MAVTRNDVAHRAGVSPALVSYVLNGGPRPVAAPTRARVLAAIEELGYKPDGLARSLKLGTTRTLGVVVPDLSNPFFAELSRAVEDAAFERGYGVLVCNTADDPARERVYINGLAERRVDGLVFVSSDGREDLKDLIGLGIPVVGLDRLPGEVPISTIETRNEHGAYIGTQHLLSHGHRSVAFVGGLDSTVTAARRTGWQAALAESGAEGSQVLAAFTFEGGRRAANDLFGAGARPSAVLVGSDVQAFGLLSGLADLNVRVPNDLAMVSFDGTTPSRYSIPSLTTIAQPIRELGAQAVSVLLDNEANRPSHVVLNPALIIRRSCGCDERRDGTAAV
jgi:LacI family transcriptional regulator